MFLESSQGGPPAEGSNNKSTKQGLCNTNRSLKGLQYLLFVLPEQVALPLDGHTEVPERSIPWDLHLAVSGASE